MIKTSNVTEDSEVNIHNTEVPKTNDPIIQSLLTCFIEGVLEVDYLFSLYRYLHDY